MAKMHLFVDDIKNREVLLKPSSWQDQFNFEDNHWRCYFVIDGEEYFFQTETEFKIYLFWVLRFLLKEKDFARKSVAIAYVQPGKPNGLLDLTKEIEFLRLLEKVIISFASIPGSISFQNTYDLHLLLYSLQILLLKEILEPLLKEEVISDSDYLEILRSVNDFEDDHVSKQMAIALFEGRHLIDPFSYLVDINNKLFKIRKEN